MNVAVDALILSLGIFIGLAWQSWRIRREMAKQAAWRRHLNEIGRVRQP